jgi:precorrin-6A synthase
MRKLLIIGIGAGDPDYLTVQAIKAMNRVDVFFIPDKGAEKAQLAEARRDICERFITGRSYRTVGVPMPQRDASRADYHAGVEDWHAKIAAAYEILLQAELREGECGGFLVWGDPSLYDSTIRIVERLRARGVAFEYEVIPGITAPQALAARHRIALNTIGGPILITTGRKIAEGFPADQDSVVVMLDGEETFGKIAPEGLEISWGAYLGTDNEILVSGKLSDVRDKIERVRREAREQNGWVMDTYLLRRS